jgi:hypothetical protein
MLCGILMYRAGEFRRIVHKTEDVPLDGCVIRWGSLLFPSYVTGADTTPHFLRPTKEGWHGISRGGTTTIWHRAAPRRPRWVGQVMSDWRDNAWVRVGIFLVVIGLIWLALRFTPAPPKYVSPPYIEQVTTAPALRTVAHDPEMSH